MRNEEQAPQDPGREPLPDGPEESVPAGVLDPDSVVLDDGGISADALEPELTVSPAALDLEEPALEPARISPEIAVAASLDDAAAEARAVAADAEEAGTLVDGPLLGRAPSPMPDGSAPPAGSAAVGPDGDPGGGPDGDPGGVPYAFPPEGGGPGAGHPDPYPGLQPEGGAAAPGHPRRDRTRAGSSNTPLLLIVGALVLLGLLIWLLVSLFGGSGDEARVDPSSLAAGECLAEFTDITEEAVLVDCAAPHNAQLVASEDYPEDAAFPGRDQLGLRAEAACAAASSGIDPDVLTEDLQVRLLHAVPTERTWADGDRRVDCFAVVEDGGPVRQSLLAR